MKRWDTVRSREGLKPNVRDCDAVHHGCPGQSVRFEIKQLDLENEGGVARNFRRLTAEAVGQFGRDDHQTFFPALHELQHLIPALDYLLARDAKSEWVILFQVFIESFSIEEPADVEDGHGVARFG